MADRQLRSPWITDARTRPRAPLRGLCLLAAIGLLVGPLGCVSGGVGEGEAHRGLAPNTSLRESGNFQIGPYDIGFRGPGRLLLIFEYRDGERVLVVSDADGARRIAAERPRDARWVAPTELLVLSEEIPEEFRLPRTHLVQIRLGSKTNRTRVLDGPRRHYDPEPSPDGHWLAIGVDIEDVGESDLEIWELGDTFERVATRAQALDEPRWSPDGLALIASHPIPDPIGSEDSLGGGFGGVSFAWSRLFRLRRDLGRPTLLHDGELPDQFATGGTLPLWWADEGIYARQRSGLVLCSPERETCRRVYGPGPDRRVVDGRTITPKAAIDSGRREALLLVARAETARLYPTEIHRVDLDTGEGEIIFRAPDETLILEIDWIETE